MKPKISDFPYYTNITEYDELVPVGVLFGDDDNTKIYTGDATEGLDTVEKVQAYEFPTEVTK